MPYYILKPKKDFLEKAETLNMVAEAGAIFGILTDEYRYPKTRKSIEEYKIRIPEQIVEFKLKTELDKNIYEYLSNFWEIEEK